MTITNITPPDTEPVPPESIIDFDAVCVELHKMGHKAYVEQSGGGTATIYAGEPFPFDGDVTYPALAGPGWFDGPNWTLGRGVCGDLYIGPGDDDDKYVNVECSDDHSTKAVATLIAIAITSHKTYKAG